jgi:hypothetical protein
MSRGEIDWQPEIESVPGREYIFWRPKSVSLDIGIKVVLGQTPYIACISTFDLR